MINMISALYMVDSRLYLHLFAGFSIYFAIIASKNVQETSALQNNSITLLLIKIESLLVFLKCNYNGRIKWMAIAGYITIITFAVYQFGST